MGVGIGMNRLYIFFWLATLIKRGGIRIRREVPKKVSF